MNLVIKDAVRQILGRVASAIGGFIVIKMITPYLGPLRFGDYSTILKFFAIRSAFADFGIYVIALKQLGGIKSKQDKASDKILNNHHPDESQDLLSGNTETPCLSASRNSTGHIQKQSLETTYSKFVSTRFFMIGIVYTLALVVAYLIPAYTSNPYLVRGLPLGMLFSASFMSAGILQIPLQLYRKMEQLSIALILARIAQISILVTTIYFLFHGINFVNDIHIFPFNLILISVIMSGVVQALYVRWQGEKYIKLTRQWDWLFTKNIIRANRQYGIAYYLSSFHTLIVLILLSMFFPTVQGYTYAGTWALALALIEILLIVPSALGNSLIHKVADESLTYKKNSFGALMHLVIWIGCIVIIGFVWFAPHLINFIGGNKYLSTGVSIGSDFILPFLGIVITLSFIKQVFNYIFVSTDLQNKLLKINFVGVIIGCTIGIPLIRKYNIMGGIVMQIFLEIIFLTGAIRIAWKNKVLPNLNTQTIIIMISIVLLIIGTKYAFNIHIPVNNRSRIFYGIVLAATRTLFSLHRLKKIMQKL